METYDGQFEQIKRSVSKMKVYLSTDFGVGMLFEKMIFFNHNLYLIFILIIIKIHS